MKDFHSLIKATRAISPVSVSDNTAQVSQVIDRQGFEALEFLISIGSVADADTTFVVLVEDSDTNFAGAAVADSFLLGTENGAAFQFDDDNETRKIGYSGAKRYVRLTITPANNASAALISAVAVLASPRKLPQSAQAT